MDMHNSDSKAPSIPMSDTKRNGLKMDMQHGDCKVPS